MQNFRKRPTYEELINDIVVEQPKIKYPDRTATILRNSHYLSQFDGNLLDLEEQEKNIDKQKLKEIEIRKIASEKKTTAGLLRTSSSQTPTVLTRIMGSQTPTTRTTETASQAWRPNRSSGGTQTDGPQAVEAATDTYTQLFDIAPDSMVNTEMEDAEAAEEEEVERVNKKSQKIKKLVSTNLGETFEGELPFLRSSAASSSTDVLLTEDTKRKRGRPTTRDKDITANVVRERAPQRGDTGGEDTKKRGRKKQQDSVPMIVENIAENQKRKNIIEDTGGETTKKRGRKTNAEKELMRLQDVIAPQKAAREEAEKAEEKKKHGVEKILSQKKSFWEKQTMATLKEQAELRGHRFTDLETKGSTSTVLGVKTKIKKFNKEDYKRVLYKILKL